MSDHKIRHLPILKDDKVVGMISIGDVVKAMIATQKLMIEQLQQYITT
jgi:CBS domain-containing protein